jgi:DNA-binding transcriptional ArsR family regulator
LDLPGLKHETGSITYHQMVVGDMTEDAIDGLFHALADPTRRDILRRCAADEPSVSRLARGYPMSFAAVQKHVAVLERAGLVTKQPHGREQLVRTDASAVARARQALDDLERTWRGRVDRMSALLAPGTKPEPKNSTIRGTG